jgi:hypothetical protein
MDWPLLCNFCPAAGFIRAADMDLEHLKWPKDCAYQKMSFERTDDWVLIVASCTVPG